MATIKFATGQQVNFNGTPTSQDVEEVAQKLGINAAPQVHFQEQPQETVAPQPGFMQGVLQNVAKPFLMAARYPMGLVQEGVGKLTGNQVDQQRGAQLTSNKPIDFGFLGTVDQAGYDDQGNKLSLGGTVKQAVGAGAEIGSYFIGGGEAAKGIEQIGKTSALQLAKRGAIEGAAIGGVGAAGQEAQKKESTAGSILSSGLTGTILGAAAGTIPGLAKGIKESASTIKSIVNPDVEDALTRAIKPGKNNTKFGSDLKMALPEIADSLKLKGTDAAKMTMSDLDQAITDTKKRVWDQYEKQLSPNAHVTVEGAPVADQIESTITKRFDLQNPKGAQKIRDIANTYRYSNVPEINKLVSESKGEMSFQQAAEQIGKPRQITLGDAEDILKEANGELHAYYAKNKVGQQVASTDPEIQHVVKEAAAIRDTLYSKLDQLTGGKSAKIKKLYGALMNIGNEVAGRAQVVARQAPASLQETIHTPWAIAKGVASVARGDVIGAAESAAQLGMSRAMKAANSSEGLIQKAFGKLLKSAKK